MVTVTLDAFSGRPNIEWVLRQEDEGVLLRRLAAAAPAAGPRRPTPDLGYRGFVIRLKREGEMSGDLRVGFGRIESKERAWADPGRNLERWLLETGRAVIGDGLASTLAGEIDAR